MSIVVEASQTCKALISELFGDAPTSNPRAAWLQAVADVTMKAAAVLPEESTERLRKAEQIVLKGDVEILPDGTANVTSQSNGVHAYHVNGVCECIDFAHAPQHLCKHRLARAIHLRALALAKTHLAALDAPPVVSTLAEPTHGIPAQHIVHIQGRPFIKYAGLLAMAHDKGLVELTATWTFNSETLSLAEAVATFNDGGHYRESGDASPDNVTKKVAPHFRRVALTRAKARVLRDALNIDMVAVEEMAEGD